MCGGLGSLAPDLQCHVQEGQIELQLRPWSVLFPNLSRRPVVAKFDQRHGSSDGGAIPLKACDERLGLTQRLATCVVDPRQPGKIEHTIGDLVRQRLYAIACGYPDGNDAARLAEDPIQKLLVGRDPISGAASIQWSSLELRCRPSPRKAAAALYSDNNAVFTHKPG